MHIRTGIAGFAAALLLGTSTALAHVSCPFCPAAAKTFAEEIETMDVSVIAKLIKLPPKTDAKSDELPKGRFEIIDILVPT